MDSTHFGTFDAHSPIDARLRLMRFADTQLQFAEPDADVRGYRVIDSNKRKLGYVRGLMVDETVPRVYFLEVAFGGLLGWGESAFFIPVEAIVRVEQRLIYINQMREREHKLDSLLYQPVLLDPPLEEALDVGECRDYYGYPPYGQL